MHLGIAECRIPSSAHCDLDLRPSFKKIAPRAYFYIFEVGIRTLGVWIHLGLAECNIQFLGHCDFDICPSFKKYCVRSISLILFAVGIPNLVCGCILG